jgi:hypothetical protein
MQLLAEAAAGQERADPGHNTGSIRTWADRGLALNSSRTALSRAKRGSDIAAIAEAEERHARVTALTYSTFRIGDAKPIKVLTRELERCNKALAERGVSWEQHILAATTSKAAGLENIPVVLRQRGERLHEVHVAVDDGVMRQLHGDQKDGYGDGRGNAVNVESNCGSSVHELTITNRRRGMKVYGDLGDDRKRELESGVVTAWAHIADYAEVPLDACTSYLVRQLSRRQTQLTSSTADGEEDGTADTTRPGPGPGPRVPYHRADWMIGRDDVEKEKQKQTDLQHKAAEQLSSGGMEKAKWDEVQQVLDDLYGGFAGWTAHVTDEVGISQKAHKTFNKMVEARYGKGQSPLAVYSPACFIVDRLFCRQFY